MAVIGLIALVTLSACGKSEEEARRFANEPPPTFAPSTATVSATSTVAPPTVPPVSSPGVLLATRGAPKRLFFAADNALWTVGADGADPHRLFAPDSKEGEIRGVAQAPGVAGSQVAVLLITTKDKRESASIVLFDAEGKELRRVKDVQSVLGKDAAKKARADALTWAPQGNQILLTFASGGIVNVPVDGDPVLLVPPDAASDPAGAAWSPAGDAVAFLAATEDGNARRLIVAPVGQDGPDPASFTTVNGASESVGQFSWLPDGSGLLYAVSGEDGGTMDGDLFQVSPDGSNRQLVASAGRAAPIAQIASFAVSPDGQSLAYTVAIPDSDGEHMLFHSLWIRSLDGHDTVAVPVPTGEFVTRLWWTSDGLIWESVRSSEGDEATEGFALDRLDRASQIDRLIDTFPAATPEPAPVESPSAAGSPSSSGDEGTPAESDGATPVDE